jgi:hypothetical protein
MIDIILRTTFLSMREKKKEKIPMYISYKLSNFDTGMKEKNRLDNIMTSHYCDDFSSFFLSTTL